MFDTRRRFIRPRTFSLELLASMRAPQAGVNRLQSAARAQRLEDIIRRRLLEDAVRDDPDPEQFEAWLVRRCFGIARHFRAAGVPAHARVSMVGSGVLTEWHLARSTPIEPVRPSRSWRPAASNGATTVHSRV